MSMKLVAPAVDAGGVATGKKRRPGSFLLGRRSGLKVIAHVVDVDRTLLRGASVSAPVPPIIEHIVADIRVDRVTKPSAHARIAGSVVGK